MQTKKKGGGKKGGKGGKQKQQGNLASQANLKCKWFNSILDSQNTLPSNPSTSGLYQCLKILLFVLLAGKLKVLE